MIRILDRIRPGLGVVRGDSDTAPLRSRGGTVSVERRLRNICGELGLNELRTRTSLAHAVVSQMLPAGVVKGGAAIKLSVGDQASRLTRDLDTARAPEHTVETYTRISLADWPRASLVTPSSASPPIRQTCPTTT